MEDVVYKDNTNFSNDYKVLKCVTKARPFLNVVKASDTKTGEVVDTRQCITRVNKIHVIVYYKYTVKLHKS